MPTCKLSFLGWSYTITIVHIFLGPEPVRLWLVFTYRIRPMFGRLNYVLWVQDIVKTFILGGEVVRGIDMYVWSIPVILNLLIHDAVEPEPPPYILCWHVAWNQSGPLLLPVSVPSPFSPELTFSPPFLRYRQRISCVGSEQRRKKQPFWQNCRSRCLLANPSWNH